MGDGHCRPPTYSTPLNRLPKKTVTQVTTSLAPTVFAMFRENPPMGAYLYFFSKTHQQVRPVDGFSRLMTQTMRTHARV